MVSLYSSLVVLCGIPARYRISKYCSELKKLKREGGDFLVNGIIHDVPLLRHLSLSLAISYKLNQQNSTDDTIRAA